MHRAHKRIVGLAALVAAVMLVAGLAAGIGPRASAQEEDAYPAHIHTGTCAALGDVVFPLNDVKGADESGTPEAMAGMDMGTPTAVAMMGTPMAGMEDADTSTTTVAAALADIISGGHAINIHESADKIQNYIACGEITGAPTDGVLQITLAELNDSGYAGMAMLKDNGDGTTTVTVMLTEEYADGTPAAAGGAASVTIKDFSFMGATLEVAVGTTVTWTNQDQAPHTVSQVGGGFESGKIDPDGNFSFTFDKPGTYEYFCQFHANMKGTIVVK